MTCTLKGRIVTPAGVVDGSLHVGADRRIAAIEGTHIEAGRAREPGAPLLVPGFIDLHVHGAGGRDIMEGGDAAASVAQRHAAHGTTALLATTMTAPMADLEAAFAG